jgi:hypothetical protein
VTITNLGTVDANGQRSVTPNQTTSYRLTARNPRGEVSAVATVVVELEPRAQFLSCTVSPANITAGETATISYATVSHGNALGADADVVVRRRVDTITGYLDPVLGQFLDVESTVRFRVEQTKAWDSAGPRTCP